jgi:hypothetical protein
LANKRSVLRAEARNDAAWRIDPDRIAVNLNSRAKLNKAP